jgi:hypothetical protein
MKSIAMSFPVVVCLVAAIAGIYVGSKLRRFKVSAVPPKSRSHLSIEERQHKIKIAERFSWGLAIFWLAGAALLAWLAP